MRINLDCPFNEKDEAKALGAWWDPARKCWFIENMEDLTPFMRWIRKGFSPKDKPVSEKKDKQRARAKVRRETPAKTKSKRHDLECNCAVLPWDHCDHSMEREENEIHAAMLEMLHV